MLPTKFQVSWPFGSRKEVKNRFSRWLPWPPSGISDLNDFSFLFYLQVTPMPPTKFQVNWSFLPEKKRKIDFQDGHHGGHLGFPIGMILAIFNLQVTPMIPTSSRLAFGCRRRAAILDFCWISWISDRNNFSCFFIYKSPRCFLQSFELVVLLVQGKNRKIDF